MHKKKKKLKKSPSCSAFAASHTVKLADYKKKDPMINLKTLSHDRTDSGPKSIKKHRPPRLSLLKNRYK